jgi:hypothetical protein
MAHGTTADPEPALTVTQKKEKEKTRREHKTLIHLLLMLKRAQRAQKLQGRTSGTHSSGRMTTTTVTTL